MTTLITTHKNVAVGLGAGHYSIEGNPVACGKTDISWNQTRTQWNAVTCLVCQTHKLSADDEHPSDGEYPS